MPFVPDKPAPTERKSRFVPDAQPDQFAGDDLLSNEAMAKLANGAQSTITPETPSMFSGVKRYAEGLNEAAGQFNRAKPSGLLGTADALTTLATGGILAPILGTAEAATFGTDPAEAFAKYTWTPRTESGRAQLGVLDALAKPITESGADIALSPLAMGESRAVAARPARIPANGRSLPRGSSIPDESVALDSAVAARPEVPGSAAQDGWTARLESVSKDAAPSREELAKQSKAAYDRAEQAGVVIKPESFANATGQIRQKLRTEGFSEKLHPRAAAALEELEASQGPVSLEQAEILRRIAKSAESSIEPDERRIGGLLVDHLDDYIDNLGAADVAAGNAAQAVPALNEARALWTRKRKADDIAELMRRAELSAPNFSASGMENAIRTEFRSLAKNEKRMRRFSKEERAAIERVAKGGKLDNVLRMVGKFTPTGVVSGALSSGAGFLAGGPVGAVALPAAGLASRYAATRMTTGNALRAEALMRRGPRVVQQSAQTIPETAEAQQRAAIAQALMKARGQN
jgi:hypothetical protein